jgi:hypothetical protein
LLGTLLVLLPGAAHAQVQVVVNGAPAQFDQPPLMRDGHVLVPLRGIFERLGATVMFDSATQSIKAVSGSSTVELRLGSTMALVNGQQQALDTPALEVGGRTLVPLRFISQALGANVTWNNATQTVSVQTSGQPSASYGSPPSAAYPAPTPPMAVYPPQSQAPVIEDVSLDKPGPLGPGQTLVVRMHGTAGGSATLDIADHRGIPMEEVRTGVYRGTYTVRTIDNRPNAAVAVHLTMPSGQSSVINANQTISLLGRGGNEEPRPFTNRLIRSVVHNAQGQLSFNQTIQVTMSAEPGGQAWVDVGSHSGIPMRETSPGTYLGTFTVPLGDVETQARIIAHLRLFNGQEQSMDVPPSVSIVGVPR